ncbi:Catenin alpha-1 [Labeo rohita]|uniref:Catenin alpha-1 n=1 Tax=Labeo rohita TaxID=84645 RepID=A0ABQ8M2X5_LABRO|nr:Catenin alpha-1 [Labeo rohita]
MKLASGEFAEDPCSSVKRGNMVRAARALLSAVTHLLVLADMADVYQLLLQLKLVEESLVKVRNAGTEQDLGIQYKALKPEVDKLNMMAAKRQQELKDVHHKDQMAAARGVLQRNVPMLYTASRACLQHPDVAAYKANRDLIYKQLQHAVSGISNAAQATSSEDSSFSQSAGGGELAYALNNFDKQIIVDPLSFSEERFRPSLEERLESIISGAALMADSSCTRDDRRERIVAECNSVRQALQDLLSEYMGNVGARQILFFPSRLSLFPFHSPTSLNDDAKYPPATLDRRSPAGKARRVLFQGQCTHHVLRVVLYKDLQSHHNLSCAAWLLKRGVQYTQAPSCDTDLGVWAAEVVLCHKPLKMMFGEAMSRRCQRLFMSVLQNVRKQQVLGPVWKHSNVLGQPELMRSRWLIAGSV